MLSRWKRPERQRPTPVSPRTFPRKATRRPGLEPLEDRCLLAAGGLDPTFGTGGKVTTSVLASANDSANTTAYQADGKLLVAGVTGFAIFGKIALTRYNTNGTLDATFGTGGRVVTSFGINNTASASAMAVQPDGKIVVAGTQAGGMVVLRYNSNGSLDSTFDGDGIANTNFPFTVTVAQVAFDSAGRVVVAGHTGTSGTGGNFLAARYNSNGTADTSFDGDGVIFTTFNQGIVRGLAIQSDNKIILAGASRVTITPFNTDFTLTRYNVDGALDNSFDVDGKVTTSIGAFDFGFAVSVNPTTGNIRLAGTSGGFVLLEYDTNGTRLGTLPTPASYGFTFDSAPPIVATFTASGKVVVAGTSGGNFAAARFTSTGVRDTAAFNNPNGFVITDLGGTDQANAVAVRPDDTVALAGFTDSNNTDFAVAQFSAAGAVLNTATTDFFISSLQQDGPPSGVVAVQPNGKVIAAGTLARGVFQSDFVVARYNVNGSLDTSFGTGGFVYIDFGGDDQLSGVAIDSSGRIIVAGSTLDTATFLRDFAVARLRSNGTLDTAFDGDGKATIDFNGSDDVAAGLGVDSSGRVVVAGTTLDFNTFTNDFAVARLRSNGTLDPAFNGTGQATIDFGGGTDDVAAAVHVSSSGRVTVVGKTLDPNVFTYDIAVARLTSAGTLSGSFGTGGKAVIDWGGDDSAAGVAVDNEDRVLIAGSTYSLVDGLRDFVVGRLRSNGTVSTSFGTGGKTMIDFGGDDFAASLAIDPHGRIVVVGTTVSPLDASRDMAVARLRQNGSLDSSFGVGGKVTLDFGGDDTAAGVAIDCEGRIIVGGNTFNENGIEFAIARLFGEEDDC